MNKLLLIGLFILCSVQGICAKSVALHNNIHATNKTEFGSVDYAIEALSEDFMRKFGTKKSAKSTLNLLFDIDKSMDVFDQYKITFDSNNIHFTGSDEIGLLHAIYTFSEDVLGIDPFIHFTHIMPERVESMSYSGKSIKSKPFTYKHRGFFINDEDLIGGFQLEKLEYGFNMDFMKRLYETTLRLKMTGIIPSTLVFSDEPHLELASDMGLYIMQHHAEPLGSVPLFWSPTEPYSWSTNKEEFIKFWTKTIERQKGRNVIWTIGFRGFLDRDFWVDDPALSKNATDADKAAIINEVIETQYRLIQEITGDKDPLVTGILWGAVRGLYNKGLIKYPPTTMIQFADSGKGEFAPSTWNDVEICDLQKGVYQHVSYHNRAAHMRINLLDPNMLCREMQKAYDYDLTSICVLNVGNFKEKIFGIQQMVNYMNDFEKYKDQQSGEYYPYYVKQRFGVESKILASCYEDFIANHFKFVNPCGDEFYSFMTENVIKALYSHKMDVGFCRGQFPKEISKELLAKKDYHSQMSYAMEYYHRHFAEVSSKWEITMQHAYDAQSELSGNKLDFYRADLMLPTEKMFHLTKMAENLSQGALHYINEDYHNAQLSIYAAIKHAEGAMEVEKRIENLHTGDFKDWYRFDENALTRVIKPYLENLLAVCKDMKYVTLPYDSRNSKTPGIQYKYQPFFKSEFRDEIIYMENAK